MYATNATVPAWACFAIGVAGLLALLLFVFAIRRAFRSSDPYPTDVQLPIETDRNPGGVLPYRSPLDERRRPGILTAVGVISIIIGSLGLAAGAFGLLNSLGALFFTTTTVATGAIAVTSTGATFSASPTSSTAAATTTFALVLPLGVRILAFVTALLQLGIAAYLIFIGIMLLRDSRHGRTQHLAFAWCKLLLVALSIWTNWAWLSAQYAGFSAGPSRIEVAIMSVLLVVPAAIYPIALLIVMNTRSVKAYYRTWVSSRLNEAL